MRVEGVAAAGSLVSGVLASACCIGPVVLGLLGMSGAALAHKFEPFRPFLLVVTYVLLGSAFYRTYKPQAVCPAGSNCEAPGPKILLWIATVIVILATTFPWYAQYLPL